VSCWVTSPLQVIRLGLPLYDCERNGLLPQVIPSNDEEDAR
jgi:hypothetical protein